ncbi:DUF6233 domain-containing protein [Streptomyces sp. NPDC001480]|uniref:DUF6233 domain-containing protein n=1 Tax=Streptomyces sp. NPDC001480 TaxID=3364577 RepID=UPI0036C69912
MSGEQPLSRLGECWAAVRSGRCRPVPRQQAVEALRQRVSACVHCRPDWTRRAAGPPATGTPTSPRDQRAEKIGQRLRLSRRPPPTL